MAEYEVLGEYLETRQREIVEGEVFPLEIRDRSTFERKMVKARVARSKEELPSGETLYVRNLNEDLEPYTLVIEVLEEMDASEMGSFEPQSDIRRSAWQFDKIR